VNQIICKGRLRHCWWGTYYATIGLFCKDTCEATHVRSKLGSLWRLHEENDTVVIYHGKESELESVLEQLESLGADRKKMTSIAKSIDFGEEFIISVQV
jgi:hypothetical protein